MIVLDASAAVDLLLRIGASGRIEERLLRSGETLRAPCRGRRATLAPRRSGMLPDHENAAVSLRPSPIRCQDSIGIHNASHGDDERVR